MLTGKPLGQALKSALQDKMGMPPSKVAEHFRIKQPSVNGWYKTGRISKSKFEAVKRLTADKVPLSHWGIDEAPLAVRETQKNYTPFDSHIREVIQMMQASDEGGRVLAKVVVAAALSQYQPSKIKAA